MTMVVRGMKLAHLRSSLIVFPSITIVAISNGVIVLEAAGCSIFASVSLIVVTTREEVVDESAKHLFRCPVDSESHNSWVHCFCQRKTFPATASRFYAHYYKSCLSGERISVHQRHYGEISKSRR